jgi:hypothetical protein
MVGVLCLDCVALGSLIFAAVVLSGASSRSTIFLTSLRRHASMLAAAQGSLNSRFGLPAAALGSPLNRNRVFACLPRL